MLENSYIDIKGLHILKTEDNKKYINSLKKGLTVSPNNNVYSGEQVSLKQYRTNDNEIIIPRYYLEDDISHIKKHFSPEKVKIKFTAQLRDYQIEITTKCLKFMKTYGGGILSVPCGRGKTIMAIYIASMLNVKTLIVVHKSFLQDQWVDRIKQFTNSTVGIIRQDRCETDCDFSVGMIQSIGKNRYGDVFNKYGLLICDEAHHYASKYFSKALSKLCIKYTLGLSATLYRNDGLAKVINWYIGNVAYKELQKQNANVNAKIIHYYSDDVLFEEKYRKIQGNLRPDCVKMINNVVQMQNRNKLIVDIINQIRKNSDRKILILSERKTTHLYPLKKMVDESIEEDIKKGKLIEGECKTFFYIGDSKQHERKSAELDADILFATFHMAQEGLDIERLNCVIFVTSKKDVVQAVGRILRKSSEISPLIIDIVDEMSIFKSQGIIREKLYKKNKYNINSYYYVNNGLVSYKTYLETMGKISYSVSDEIPTLENILQT